MRPIDKSVYAYNKDKYKPYGDAKHDLIAALGQYCSFCEREGFSASLEVEHIESKNVYPEKKYLWTNFLLACKNCNSIKGASDVDFLNILLPHLDNTYFPFRYLESGFLTVKTELDAATKLKVNNLITLVGLDRRPGHVKYSTKDTRWLDRKKAWELAQKYYKKYVVEKYDVGIIIDLAQGYGFWSIWMHTFETFPEVQKELILKFNGTNKKYFTNVIGS